MKKLSLLLLTLFTLSVAKAQSIEAVDGPYIMLEGKGMRYMVMAPDGSFVDTLYARTPSKLRFTVLSDDGSHRFDVGIRPKARHKRLPEQLDVDGDIIVLSDPHGDFGPFLSVLRNNGVVGEELEWSFGSNTLVIIGDIFDRGGDVNTLFWFIEKLRQEAESAGGRVIFQLGNHEDLVLKGNLRYTKDKYKRFADRAKIPLHELYGKESYLGRTIRSANIVSRLNENIIVHAGLGEEFFRRGLTFGQINLMADRYIGLANDSLDVIGGDVRFVFRTTGPLWYRGMVRDNDTLKHPPVPLPVLDSALSSLGASRVIVGHTIFPDVTLKLSGRVVTVNVDNAKNCEAGLGRGLLIRDGVLYVIFDRKAPVLLEEYISKE